MCGTIPSVQPNAATTLARARAPREAGRPRVEDAGPGVATITSVVIRNAVLTVARYAGAASCGSQPSRSRAWLRSQNRRAFPETP